MIVAVVIVLRLLAVPSTEVGLYVGAPWWHRLTYQFFHAGWIHLAVNCWALLCIVFLYEIDLKMLLGALAAAASFPCGLLAPLYSTPMLTTIGLSGMCYALLGRYSFGVKRKLYYQLWWAFFIGIGFFFPSVNAILHLYCYLCGLLLALLNKPFTYEERGC